MKVLINSYPRSGATTFTDAIRMSTISKRIEFGEEFFHNPAWVAKSHIPVIFLGEFPKDIVIGTILRDPVDAIASNSFRWANGHTGNLVQGKIVIDKQREAKENKFDSELTNLIRHQVQQYISYYDCLKNGSQNILKFSYEDIQNNVGKCIDRIVLKSGKTIDNINYDIANSIIKNPPQPTKEKTELYYQIRKYIESLEESKNAYSLYYDILFSKESV